MKEELSFLADCLEGQDSDRAIMVSNELDHYYSLMNAIGQRKDAIPALRHVDEPTRYEVMVSDPSLIGLYDELARNCFPESDVEFQNVLNLASIGVNPFAGAVHY